MTIGTVFIHNHYPLSNKFFFHFSVPSTCLKDVFYLEEVGCHPFQFTIGILLRKLNLTIALESNTASAPSLHLSTLFNPSEYSNQRMIPIHVCINTQTSIGFIYCHYKSHFMPPSWRTFVLPFDAWIWSWILFTATSFAIYYQSLRQGYNILAALVGQFPQDKRWPFLSLLCFMVLMNAYLAVVTTHLIKPPLEKQFRTFQDAVEESDFRYRHLCTNMFLCEQFVKNVQKRVLEINDSIIHYLI